MVRKEVGLKLALDTETAKKVSAAIKEAKLSPGGHSRDQVG